MVIKKLLFLNRFVAIVLLAVLSMANAAVAGNNPGDSLVPVEMKYGGLLTDKPVFFLNFSGTPTQNDFTIIVTDEYGNALYKETTRGEIFTKKFLLNTDEIGDNTLKFEILCNNNRQSVSFEVNRNTRFFQDVAIRRIK